MSYKAVLFLLIISLDLILSEDLISLPNGKIRGQKVVVPGIGKTIYSYQGIPYAAPPIKNLRFMPPTEPKNWEGILNATQLSLACPQWRSNKIVHTSEDCLYLNVYTSVKPETKSLYPVFLYIHGGQFANGTGDRLPYYFVEKDIVGVVINYRLGPFGFISTKDEVLPGNYGIKDQILALKWVQKNIHLFGGDPNKVTIGGQSSGAANVANLVISSKAKGLFRGAILESGSAICNWASQINSKEYAYQIGKTIDPNFTDLNTTQELRSLLMEASSDQINLALIEGPQGYQLGQGHFFAPSVEPQHDSAVITELMHESIKNGQINQVPMIIGVNSEERLMEGGDLESFKKTMAFYDDNLPLIVSPDFLVNKSDLMEAGQDFRKIYTNGGRFEDNLGAAITFKSDIRYTTGVLRHAFLQSSYSDVYAYVFSYHGELGKNNFYVEGADRVKHTEELWYSWYNGSLDKYPKSDVITHERLIKLWTNFIKYLNPTPECDELLEKVKWPKVSQDKFLYLNINESLQVSVNPKKYKEWQQVVDRFGNPPFNTY